MMGFGYGYGWVLMLVGGLIVIGIIALIIYALVRGTTVSGKSGSTTPTETQQENVSRALSVLAERYARGEITDEEYKQKKIEITRP
ncbi:MAG: SHOCT domain-containing protein [Saccharofermentanales bacterium]